MTDLLTVKFLSPDIKYFDPLPAVHYFNQGHHRRPRFLDQRGKATADVLPVMTDQAVQEMIDNSEADVVAEDKLGYSDYESDSDCESDYYSPSSDIDIEELAQDD